MSVVKSGSTERQMAVLLVLILLQVIAGCAKNDGSAASSGAGQGDAALVAIGKAAFDGNGCARCHTIGGQGGHMGPDLTRVGAEAGHTPAWLVEHVKNPRAHNPRSRMPAFEGKISDRDLSALGAYLSSLR